MFTIIARNGRPVPHVTPRATLAAAVELAEWNRAAAVIDATGATVWTPAPAAPVRPLRPCYCDSAYHAGGC